VRVGGLMVNQGDLLHGDSNGVTSIPLDIAESVADVASEFVRAEAIVMDYVKAPGNKSIVEFKQRRKEFQSMVARLARECRPRAAGKSA
jgi:4-hydroxy-4-methyl-2-oxoglutarate aldolase